MPLKSKIKAARRNRRGFWDWLGPLPARPPWCMLLETLIVLLLVAALLFYFVVYLFRFFRECTEIAREWSKSGRTLADLRADALDFLMALAMMFRHCGQITWNWLRLVAAGMSPEMQGYMMGLAFLVGFCIAIEALQR